MNSIFLRLTEMMSEEYQEFEDDFIFQLPEMVSSLRKEIFFFEPESKKENETEETLILTNRKKDQEIKELREKLSNQEQSKDEEMLELSEKLASLNFQLEQAETRLKNQSISKIKAPTESVQMKNTPEKAVPRENNFLSGILRGISSFLPRNIPEEENSPKWTSFEFVTKRRGAKGPTKSECIGYYTEK